MTKSDRNPDLKRQPDPPYQIPPLNRLARAILRPALRALFRLLSDINVSGAENVPGNGAYIIAINHVSLYEAPLVLAFWPILPEAVGAVDIWSRTGQGVLARLYGGIPIQREKYDRKVVEDILKVLQSDRPLLIAPEGERSHRPGMQQAKPGVAYIIDLAEVPVLPVGIVGTTDDFLDQAFKLRRPRLEIRIGEPLYLPPIQGKGSERRAARQQNADLIMYHIAKLLPREYRGYYGQSDQQA